ncbi:uncharacterized protein CLUP02_11837 [Colletotrichum lupini]|uniref:Uncharacterized protein n=1 Tax=Colletotrichum lupini TaxID=145971 RepID=A0A9Q8SZF8_9PEZI|nr:uncharacterized protein CLUP02_11837 [Colletotrichum lupini]UQC86337.1 hypothetical protein CLUP02_11837 [Colletotrichum lupini]
MEGTKVQMQLVLRYSQVPTLKWQEPLKRAKPTCYRAPHPSPTAVVLDIQATSARGPATKPKPMDAPVDHPQSSPAQHPDRCNTTQVLFVRSLTRLHGLGLVHVHFTILRTYTTLRHSPFSSFTHGSFSYLLACSSYPSDGPPAIPPDTNPPVHGVSLRPLISKRGLKLPRDSMPFQVTAQST